MSLDIRVIMACDKIQLGPFDYVATHISFELCNKKLYRSTWPVSDDMFGGCMFFRRGISIGSSAEGSKFYTEIKHLHDLLA